MKIALYILLGLALLISAFFAWFFLVFMKVSDLKIDENADSTVKLEQIDKWLTQLQQEGKFNGGVLIAKAGKPLLIKGYGYADARKEQPLHEHTSFRLASVSKQFTATGIMLLKEQGKLNYDDLVTQYIPDFPYATVTIRQLLNQTSGVPDNYLTLAEKNKTAIDILTNKKAIQLVIDANEAADFDAGTQYAYSNTNYITLAHLIAIISGQSFEQFMQEQLFQPLDMQDSRVWNLLSADSTFQNKAADMRNFKGNLTTLQPTFIDGVAGDGAIFSSLHDFLIWDRFWYGNDLIDDEHLQEAFRTPTLADGEQSDYGFGWVVREDVVWHNGAWLGARTLNRRDRKEKTLLVILDNGTNIMFDDIAQELVKVVRGGL
ncbi:MAG: serine hydrolase domain-containing protein [Bacteroidota bacterium]